MFQVDHIGNQILSKLLRDWKLMDELGVLRDVYLLGSGNSYKLKLCHKIICIYSFEKFCKVCNLVRIR